MSSLRNDGQGAADILAEASMLDILLLFGGTALILLMDGYAALCARI